MLFKYIKVKTKGLIEGEELLVPKLRFKEFKDEWKEISLINVFTFYNTNSLSRADLSEEGLIKNIHYGDIHQKFNNILDVNKEKLPYIKSDIKVNIHNEENYCQDGDLILADASEDYDGIGKAVEVINVGNNKIVSGLHTILARDTNKVMSLGFKGYLFNIPLIHNQIRVLANGFKVYGISKNNIYDIDVRIPTKTEQEKITNFLILLDKKIDLQQRRIEALKIYKRGLIQRIYNRTWNNKIKMEEILIQKSIRNTNDEIQNVYSVSNKDGFILQTEQFKDRIVASEDTRNYKVVAKNDFAYNPARINVGSIARMKQDIKGIISPMYICFKCNEKILPEYLEYFFESSKFTYEMSKRLEGSVRMCLSYESMLNIPIELPNKNEQEKISTFLNSLSNKIKLEEKKFMELNKLKKGLLQKMFI